MGDTGKRWKRGRDAMWERCFGVIVPCSVPEAAKRNFDNRQTYSWQAITRELGIRKKRVLTSSKAKYRKSLTIVKRSPDNKLNDIAA